MKYETGSCKLNDKNSRSGIRRQRKLQVSYTVGHETGFSRKLQQHRLCFSSIHLFAFADDCLPTGFGWASSTSDTGSWHRL
uniref:Uncharacterized protein n=1 Tax=Nelumbo nucifera TaxID=4432 RepID=A0A822XL03_NELNU|nr:TPA_asm: hypothetical protein HUJ06_020958 [Nelumbo nucifera]